MACLLVGVRGFGLREGSSKVFLCLEGKELRLSGCRHGLGPRSLLRAPSMGPYLLKRDLNLSWALVFCVALPWVYVGL